uniref:Uncharacterized protein n=1 Tax=Anopheles atroparvus TaxID=41427 RepID=A0A182JIR7_ANOAO
MPACANPGPAWENRVSCETDGRWGRYSFAGGSTGRPCSPRLSVGISEGIPVALLVPIMLLLVLLVLGLHRKSSSDRAHRFQIEHHRKRHPFLGPPARPTLFRRVLLRRKAELFRCEQYLNRRVLFIATSLLPSATSRCSAPFASISLSAVAFPISTPEESGVVRMVSWLPALGSMAVSLLKLDSITSWRVFRSASCTIMKSVKKATNAIARTLYRAILRCWLFGLRSTSFGDSYLWQRKRQSQ